jgi:hypothetical protein
LRSNAGWWKRETADLIWWRNFLHEKYRIDNLDFDYGGGWAVGEGTVGLSVSSSQLKKDYVLLARVMESSRGGKIEFWQGEEKIGEIDTKIENPKKVEMKLTGYKEIPDQIFEYDKADFAWFEIGRLIFSEPLEIRTRGDINVVNALVAIPKDEWQTINEKARKHNVIDFGKLSEYEKKALFTEKSEATLSYERISPTHYRIKIEDLVKPASLAFSETYDPLWIIRKVGTGTVKYSLPLYSLVNGFVVEEDGEYDVYFEPQKYVLPGLAISGLTLVCIVFLATKRRRH